MICFSPAKFMGLPKASNVRRFVGVKVLADSHVAFRSNARGLPYALHWSPTTS